MSSHRIVDRLAVTGLVSHSPPPPYHHSPSTTYHQVSFLYMYSDPFRPVHDAQQHSTTGIPYCHPHPTAPRQAISMDILDNDLI